MINRWVAGFWLVLLLVLFFHSAMGQLGSGWACAKVDPFWGCDPGGTFVGVCSPFGMVKLGPDCQNTKIASGYQSDKPIIGFSINHLSGSGRDGYYGNILATPMVGDPNWKARPSESKNNEQASPGFYGVTLVRQLGEVDVALTANQNVGKHLYRFRNMGQKPDTKASILIDLTHSNSRDPKSAFKGCDFDVSPDGSFYGNASFTADSNPYILFFSGQVNIKNPTVSYRIDTAKSTQTFGAKKKLVLRFDTIGFAFSGQVADNEEIELTIGISYKNKDEAQAALTRSLALRFEDVRAKSMQAWEDRLSVFQVRGMSDGQERIFYSALYHTLIEPTDVTGNHPRDQFGESHFWDLDSERAYGLLSPLHSLIYAQNQRRICNSLIRIGEDNGGLPNHWGAGGFVPAMGGSQAEVILADAVIKGLLTGLDAGKAWKLCSKNATQASSHPEHYGRSSEYIRYGYCSSSITQSLEYAYNDFVMSRLATKLGKDYEAGKFKVRSLRVMTLWDPGRKAFRLKDTLGNWKTGPGSSDDSFLALHLMDTIRSLLGGNEAVIAQLNSNFENHLPEMKRPSDWDRPFGYLYASRPDLTATHVQKLVAQYFKPGRAGMPALDASGALSAWLIWACLGIHPMPGTDDFYIFNPNTSEITVNISGGKVLKIKGVGAKPYWNNKALPSFRLKAAEIQSGGVLEWRDK